MALKTNYKDYIPKDGKRKYKSIANSDNTVTLDDVTDYTQVGDSFGAKDVNAITSTVNVNYEEQNKKIADSNSKIQELETKEDSDINALTTVINSNFRTQNDKIDSNTQRVQNLEIKESNDIKSLAEKVDWNYKDQNKNICNNTDKINKLEEDIINLIYPIGVILEFGQSVDPNKVIGGTWERYAKGRFLVGIDSNDADFREIGRKGGGKTHTHGSLNNINGTLETAIGAIGDSPATLGYIVGNSNNVFNSRSTYTIRGEHLGGGHVFNHFSKVFGETDAANHLPLYMTVERWIRVK